MDTTQNTKETDLKSVVYTDAYWCNVAITHTHTHAHTASHSDMCSVTSLPTASWVSGEES